MAKNSISIGRADHALILLFTPIYAQLHQSKALLGVCTTTLLIGVVYGNSFLLFLSVEYPYSEDTARIPVTNSLVTGKHLEINTSQKGYRHCIYRRILTLPVLSKLM